MIALRDNCTYQQIYVCNRLYAAEQRLCRWLLLCRDRAMSDELLMTQKFIASMLGGRRESVAVAAGHLQREKPLFWRATPDDDEHYVYAIAL